MKVGIATSDRVLVHATRRTVTARGDEPVADVLRTEEEVLQLCRSGTIDVLLLDLAFTPQPGALVRRIRAESPVQVLVIAPAKSSLAAKEPSVTQAYEAIEAGAVDVVPAPSLDLEGQLSGEGALSGRLAILEKLRGLTPASGLQLLSSIPRTKPSMVAAPGAGTVVAIGASTGGPAVLTAILQRLPRDLPAAIVIVQHIDETFAGGLVGWLAERTGFRTVAALDGDPLRPATAHVAALDRHLVVTPDRLLRYVDEPRESIHRPSVDVLFASLATQNRTGLAILLTGMGRDGAEGLLQLRRSGWTTVAQDMKSSTVWGMPRAAIELGGAELVLPAEAIAPTIEAFVVRAARLR